MARYTEQTVNERAQAVQKQRRLRKIVPLAVGILGTLIFVLFVISLSYNKFGSFSVSVNKQDQLDYGIALAETKDFAQPTAYLNCRASKEITNISGALLDNVDLGAIDGVDNGANYLCYTFYLKNTGKKILTYDSSILITDMSLGIEKAVRIRLISKYNSEDAKTVDYARAAGVENGESVPEPNTTMFYSKNTVMRESVKDFAPDDVMKYTVVIWLEGPDPDCLDDIIGGEFKIDMKFTVDEYSVVDK